MAQRASMHDKAANDPEGLSDDDWRAFAGEGVDVWPETVPEPRVESRPATRLDAPEPPDGPQAPSSAEGWLLEEPRPGGLKTPGIWVMFFLGFLAAVIVWSVLPGRDAAPAFAVVEAAQIGTASITSQPSALPVLVDGQARGTTPLTLMLTAGPHTLQVRGGSESSSLLLTIAAGATVSPHFDLPRSETSASGRLDVTSEPSDLPVMLDGVPAGRTPLTLASIAAGDHVVIVGGDSTGVAHNVTILPDVTASVAAIVAPPVTTAGWVSLRAPFEMQVFEGDRLLGGTSSNRLLLSAGGHQLELVSEAMGFRASLPVWIVPGRRVTQTVAAPNGVLSINAVPWADVRIDGEPVGRTPLANLTVPVGSHEIIWTHPLHGERRQTVIVKADAPVRIGIDFEQ